MPAHDPLTLIEPSLEWRQEYLAVIEEHIAAGEERPSFEIARQDFPAYIEQLVAMSSGAGLLPGLVPMTTFWLVNAAGSFIGESRLRHFLTPALAEEGGHIGYSIRPSQRRQGYGTRILALTMQKARLLGLRRVMLTCDDDNLGSARIIEKNGGLLESKGISSSSHKLIRRYWIDLYPYKGPA
jgi:predicted acetyltransferase